MKCGVFKFSLILYMFNFILTIFHFKSILHVSDVYNNGEIKAAEIKKMEINQVVQCVEMI
jgi:hypothetical protein